VEFEDKRDAEDAVRVSFLLFLDHVDLRLEGNHRFKAAGYSLQLCITIPTILYSSVPDL
jgi:hypothetical protein